ncbi:CDP-glycerol glycerophosphotransferase family protein [Streptomyces sp. NPDC100445]|uniref:bifunctional glycosyltransferase/CDP-glycerol:glycerophosphate glycerophosphotransferase n=1 Tax=Streptomyces sp. NPDC100445 TaxID=3366102 RepID=UPI0037FFCBBD
MPRFSVIVPAYQVQAYLPECLDSVLSQSWPDLELIAVDDCSPDACGAIIDEYAARDARVKPLHLAANRGLGPARNAGMAEATGDYLVFLDSDDTLTPDALRAVAGRLEETGDPDVLVFDYARTYWDGRTVRNQLAGRLDQQGPAPFRLADRPGLLGLLMVAWNKAYRREFVTRNGFRFPPGHYEDTPWTFPVLMTAGSLATLDRVCVHYRQRRRGSILGTTSRKHFDLFEQYDRVFAYVDGRPELARWKPELLRRMLDHHAVVFSRRDRLPRGSHGEYLRQARAQYRRHRVPGLRLEPRHVLVGLGLHRTFRTLRLAAAVRRRARRAGGRWARGLRTAVLRLHYRVQLCLPLRADRAVFTAHDGHGGDPAALEEAFRAHAPRVRTAWVVRPGQERTAPAGPRPLTPGTAACWTALARSRYLVADTGFGARTRKRPGQVFVQTGRGTPLAHTGLDLLELPAAARGTDFAELLRGVDQWDHVLSGNRHTTLIRERTHPGRYTTLEYGLPRNDVLQRATAADVARLRAELGVPRDAVAILYAPAHRAHLRTQRPPLDLGPLLRRLGPRFVVLARTHLPVRGTGIIDVSGHPDPAGLCLASDALLTDHAPVMFDYANLDRPVVLHTPDREAYEAVHGTYLDLRAFPPGPVVRGDEELADVFATGLWCGPRAAALRAAFRERFCPWDDGHAAERVVRRVVLGETDLPPVVPPGERTPAPAAGARVVPVAAPQPPDPLPVTESR